MAKFLSFLFVTSLLFIAIAGMLIIAFWLLSGTSIGNSLASDFMIVGGALMVLLFVVVMIWGER